MKVVAISDMHVGSRVGLCDPSSKEVPSGDVGAPVRAHLFQHWQEACSGKWTKPDVLLFLGDAIEGQNRKQFGLGTWTSDLWTQCDHAAALLEMWGAREVYMVRGSGYHVEADHSGFQCEEYIGRKIGAMEFGPLAAYAARLAVASAAGGGAAWLLNRFIAGELGVSFPGTVASIVISGLAGFAVFYVLSLVLGLTETRDYLRRFLRR